ncbi:MAG: hypothetical protein JWM58_4556 [Rhizobium sp.]|nr:hypothetical protein [Rhizobium sp.]
MQSSGLPSIAVIADAHFHDPCGSYDIPGVACGERIMALRPFANVVRSTRVFNESSGALRHALDDISARGIRHVVLLGDYSDDGQAATIESLRNLLDEYTRRHGIRFIATPGNHDIFGPSGRHRSKRFLNDRGGHDLVTSDPARPPSRDDDAVIIIPGMRCAGYPEGVRALPDAGFFPAPHDIHWETPFGQEDDPQSRLYQVRSPDGRIVRSLMDASYLVEAVEGIWMLMIDANVFVPVDGTCGTDEDAFEDSTDAGWNAMLIHKRFILEWAKDVSLRAKTLGKTLLAFSHYPALDPLDNTLDSERSVLGQTSLSRRIPHPDLGMALKEAGIRIHFSGHLHVNDTARLRDGDDFLVNISVPSLVAFPCAYKIASVEAGNLRIDTIGIGDMALDKAIMRQYRLEAATSGIGVDSLLSAVNYGAFLSEHLGHLVGRRFLRREWPCDLAQAAGELNLADLAVLARTPQHLPLTGIHASIAAAHGDQARIDHLLESAAEHGVEFSTLSAIPVMVFLGDWYRVRMGSDLGLDAIAPESLSAYRFLSALYRDCNVKVGSAQAAFRTLFQMFELFTSGLPSENFTIDLKTGDITAID